jgi:hypothetical protein
MDKTRSRDAIGVVLLALCRLAALAAATFPPAADLGSRPAKAAPPATPTSAGVSAPTPSPEVSTEVPGLAPEAAAHLEIVAVSAEDFEGLEAYRLTLSTGMAWAVSGTPDVVVPRARQHPSYNEFGSVFFLSGAYVIYVPSVADMPEGFQLHTGPEPGMTVIDADLY